MSIMIHFFHIISILSFSTDYIIAHIRQKNKCSLLLLSKHFAIHLAT